MFGGADALAHRVEKQHHFRRGCGSNKWFLLVLLSQEPHGVRIDVATFQRIHFDLTGQGIETKAGLSLPDAWRSTGCTKKKTPGSGVVLYFPVACGYGLPLCVEGFLSGGHAPCLLSSACRHELSGCRS